MAKPKPEATSTPKLLHVTGRKGIKDHEYEDSAQSPIGNVDGSPKMSPYKLRAREGRSPNLKRNEHSESANRSYSRSPHHSPSRHRSHSPSESSSEDEQNYLDEERSQRVLYEADYPDQGELKQQTDWAVGKFIGIFGILFLVVAFVFAKYDNVSDVNFNLDEEIKKSAELFSNQDKDFLMHIKSNLKEISLLNQPKTIMFLYEANSENMLNEILNKVSKIGVCQVTSCKNKPITIDGDILNKSEFVKDYGKIISKYKNSLKESGVLLVKNLERVAGTSAQAFHSICDDYNPIVQRALILFTVKVDKIPEKLYQLRFLEDLFLKLWSNIGKDDKFYPLFTRITGTVLAVKSE